ncbi:hypothetical protein BC835DRAFT_1309323 [Cytidiella melzeri]|nr:hypothetical protein BC835DRAFT_1309323 [Cytidiella melzeri]
MTLRMLYKDEEKYRNLLQSIISSAEESTDNGRTQLSLLEQRAQLRISTVIQDGKRNGQRDLVYPSDPGSAEHEEVVVRLSGFVLRTNLPPITRIEQLPKNPYAARQSLTLTGLSLSNFDSTPTLETQQRWWSLISGSIQPLFYPRDIAIDPYINPHGILTSKVTTGRHTEDNTVLYFERMRLDAQLKYVYNPCKPTAIRVGHIVEVQASFCSVPTSKGRFVMLMKLRSGVNNQVFHSLVKQPTSLLKKVKRTVGYDTQTYDTDHPVAGMKRLRIHAEEDMRKHQRAQKLMMQDNRARTEEEVEGMEDAVVELPAIALDNCSGMEWAAVDVFAVGNDWGVGGRKGLEVLGVETDISMTVGIRQFWAILVKTPAKRINMNVQNVRQQQTACAENIHQAADDTGLHLRGKGIASHKPAVKDSTQDRRKKWLDVTQ